MQPEWWLSNSLYITSNAQQYIYNKARQTARHSNVIKRSMERMDFNAVNVTQYSSFLLFYRKKNNFWLEENYLFTQAQQNKFCGQIVYISLYTQVVQIKADVWPHSTIPVGQCVFLQLEKRVYFFKCSLALFLFLIVFLHIWVFCRGRRPPKLHLDPPLRSSIWIYPKPQEVPLCPR